MPENEKLNPFNRIGISFSIFLLLFIITSLLNYPYLNMPPVLDSTAIFSPAIYLFENNYDFSSLLQQNGFGNGGPNTDHSLSIITFLTVFIMSLFNGNSEQFLPVLHTIQFAFTGLVLTCSFFIAQRLTGRIIATVICLDLLSFPLILVQTGFLYMEIPGAALVMCSVFAWAKQYIFTAFIFAAAACMVKSFGIALIFSLAILILLDATIPNRQKLAWIFGLILITSAIEILKWSALENSPFDRNNYFIYFFRVFIKLNLLPELKFLITAALCIPCVILLKWPAFNAKKINKKNFLNLISDDISQRLLVVTYLLPLVFIGFILTVPLIGKSFFPLLRYYIWCLPLIFIGTVYAVKLCLISIFKHHSKFCYGGINVFLSVFLIGIALFFIVNRDGRYYPSLGNEINYFGSVERSYEYLDYYNIQRKSIVSLVKLQNDLPAFVTLGEYYYLSSPLMGYVNKPVTKLHLLVNKPYNTSNLADFPDEFLLLDVPNNRIHGGLIVKALLEKARADSRYSVKVMARHQVGPYKSTIYHISKISSPAMRDLNYGANGFVSG